MNAAMAEKILLTALAELELDIYDLAKMMFGSCDIQIPDEKKKNNFLLSFFLNLYASAKLRDVDINQLFSRISLDDRQPDFPEHLSPLIDEILKVMSTAHNPTALRFIALAEQSSVGVKCTEDENVFFQKVIPSEENPSTYTAFNLSSKAKRLWN